MSYFCRATSDLDALRSVLATTSRLGWFSNLSNDRIRPGPPWTSLESGPSTSEVASSRLAMIPDFSTGKYMQIELP